tara:strand:- start:2712 stop:2861 length:150 start_codon:yes stop_codon:yes gene_type:complete
MASLVRINKRRGELNPVTPLLTKALAIHVNQSSQIANLKVCIWRIAKIA